MSKRSRTRAERSKEAVVHSVERELRRRRRELQMLLALAAVPLLIAGGFIVFARSDQGDIDLQSELRSLAANLVLESENHRHGVDVGLDSSNPDLRNVTGWIVREEARSRDDPLWTGAQSWHYPAHTASPADLRYQLLTLRSELEALRSRPVEPLPPGSIIGWFEREGSPPPGWGRCDGSAGTPDMTTLATELEGVTFIVKQR